MLDAKYKQRKIINTYTLTPFNGSICWTSRVSQTLTKYAIFIVLGFLTSTPWLVLWHSGRMLVFDQRAFAVLRSTYS